MEMYSQTKLITCLCALILVQEGKAKLDDTAQVDKVLPELKDLPVLHGYDDNGEAILQPATQKTTLRMLMSHSAGQPPCFSQISKKMLLAAYPKKGFLICSK